MKLRAGRALIIAEAGVNHNGDIALAKKLIEVAARAGVDMVKFQMFDADSLVTQSAEKAGYQKKYTDANETQFQMLKKLEFKEAFAYQELIKCSKVNGVGFLLSVFDQDNLWRLVDLDLSLYKIPSGELTNLPYLRQIGAMGKPIIMSAGMATMCEIGDAINVLLEQGLAKEKITILHCNTEYPTPMIDVNLNAMLSIRDQLGIAVGYSDHTLGIEIPVAAVAVGATVVEKHFTLDKKLPGPDHAASLDPCELKEMTRAIRNVECAFGDGIKRPSTSEIKNKSVVRKSLVAATNITAGDVFTKENLRVKRPGNGISPMRWDEVLGKQAQRDFVRDEQIEL